MITLDDIKDMTCLTREEIDALAEHENLHDFNATMLGEYIMHQHHGAAHVNRMICDDIRAALHKGDKAHARELFAVLHRFVAENPDAARGADA